MQHPSSPSPPRALKDEPRESRAAGSPGAAAPQGSGWRGRRVAIVAVAFVVALASAFLRATDFIGDDHVFLAWARYAPSPLSAFLGDAHGGEYYRPLAFLWWWLLGRGFGFAAAPFAVFMALGHALAAALIAHVLQRAGESRAVAFGAAAIFFAAPAQVDAVSWYAASTDLLACLLLLCALSVCGRRPRPRAVGCALVLLALALLCKESAATFPLMLLQWLGGIGRERVAPRVKATASAARPSRARTSAPLWGALAAALLLTAYLLWRHHLLHGWGGAGDALPSVGRRLIGAAVALPLWLSGAPAGTEPVLAVMLGAGLLLALLVHARLPAIARPAPTNENAGCEESAPSGLLPFALLALALAPLLAVAEPTAHRYTYVAGFPLAWLVARALFADGRRKLGGVLLSWLVLGSAWQLVGRASEVDRYRARVKAARLAVAEGFRAGHRLFHVVDGIKDLDLAVKEDDALAPRRDEFLVLSDVPASFAYLAALPDRTLLASPPLPPSGAYRFGDVRIAGLSRRGSEPTLEEAFSRWPHLRLLRPCAPLDAKGATTPEKLCDVTEAQRP